MESSSSSSRSRKRLSAPLRKDWLLALAWAIFYTEGGSRAKVPFGWIKQKYNWSTGYIAESSLLIEVARYIQSEWRRHISSGGIPDPGAFIYHLAINGYNVDPDEQTTWCVCVKSVFDRIMEL